MKIYVFVDLEGISGISGKAYISPDLNRPDLIALGRRYMAADINACIEGCFKAGTTEVIVKDGHGAGNNVTRADIDPRADLIDGHTPRERFADIDGAAGLILLGYHAMGGTAGAVLEHTYNSTGYQNIWLNGRKAGEIGIDAAIAAEHGVPVIMVSESLPRSRGLVTRRDHQRNQERFLVQRRAPPVTGKNSYTNY